MTYLLITMYRLPGPEVLLEPGRSDGQVKMVRRGTTVKCYTWSVAENTWNEVGDVMGAKGASEGKTMYQGQVGLSNDDELFLKMQCSRRNKNPLLKNTVGSILRTHRCEMVLFCWV